MRAAKRRSTPGKAEHGLLASVDLNVDEHVLSLAIEDETVAPRRQVTKAEIRVRSDLAHNRLWARSNLAIRSSVTA